MEIKKTLVTKPPRTMKLNKFVTLESGLRPKGGVGGILEGIPSLGGEHLNADGGFIFEKIKYIPEDFFQVLNKGHIYPNDIILVKDGATTGKTSFVDNDFPHKRAVVNEHLFIVRVDPKVAFPKYVFYYLFSSEGQKQILSDFRGATVGGISRDFPLKVNVPILLMPKQTQIANFLDRKTEQIDDLIRIKERRIELLQEQRTALINQTVTKGLDPNVEMKPSGVKWIGEIPAHWKVKRLKHVAQILPSNVDKHIHPDEVQVRLCNYTDVYYNDYITVDTVLAKGSCKEREFAKFALRKGDVIITKDSETPDDIGVPTYVKDGLENVVCGYHLTMIRHYACRGEFIFRFIQSDRTRRYFELESNGITRYGLGKPSIENLFLPIPPDSEQRQIANFLDRKTQQIDELIATEQRKIQLLKEYRQSLISEAVTGKIDVRDER